MQCTNCGADLSLGKSVCPTCGTPCPQLPPNFSEIENGFISLLKRFQAKEIDLATYQVEIQKFVIQDQAGKSWWLGGDTVQWHLHDGKEWVPHDPPIAESIAQPQSAPAKSTGGKSKIRWFLLVIPAVTALLCLCIAVLYFTGVFDTLPISILGGSEPTESSLTTEVGPSSVAPTSLPGTGESPVIMPMATLSDQQQLLIDEFGWPDSFTILEADVDQGESVRFETWIYYTGRTSFTFFDGVFQVEGDTEILPSGFISTPHHPDQFPLNATPEQIQALLTDHELVPLENSDAIEPGGQMFVSQQLVVGFLDNRLFYVDALTFVPEGSE